MSAGVGKACQNEYGGRRLRDCAKRMTDILIHDVDEALAERLRQLSIERNLPVNDVIVRALRYALGQGGEDFAQRERRDIAHLRGTWNTNEATAFSEALKAFERVDGTPLFAGDENAAGADEPAQRRKR